MDDGSDGESEGEMATRATEPRRVSRAIRSTVVSVACAIARSSTSPSIAMRTALKATTL